MILHNNKTLRPSFAMVLRSSFPELKVTQVSVAEHVFQTVQQFDDSSLAMLDPNENTSWTYGQVREEAIDFALKLRSVGVQKGDVVGLVVEYEAKFFPLLLGIALCGATIAGGNNKLTPRDNVRQLLLVSARFCICDSLLMKERIKEGLPEVTVIDLVDVKAIALGPDKKSVEEILKSSQVDINRDPFLIAFTSGTTGQPKAIVITNASFMANIASLQVVLDLRAGERMLTICQHWQTFGYSIFFVYFTAGVSNIVTQHLTPAMFSECVAVHKLCGAIITDSVTFRKVAEEAELKANHTVRFLTTGGAPTPKHVLQNAAEKFNCIVSSGYGSSEGGVISCCVTEPPPCDSVGMLLPNMQLKVVDIENGTELGAGQQGELCVKSPSVFRGYLGNEEATKAALNVSGWLRTGDIGYYDQNGFVYVVDRLNNLIKSIGNMSVYPAQMESVLLSHPGIEEATVVRTTHPIYNEAAKAFVVKKDQNLKKDDLLAFYNGQVAECHRLFGGLEFVDSIPKMASGKINRRALLDL